MTANRLDKICLHFFKIADAMTGEITCGNCEVVLSERVIDFRLENVAQTTDEYQSNARTEQKISLKMAYMGLSASLAVILNRGLEYLIPGCNKQNLIQSAPT